MCIRVAFALLLITGCGTPMATPPANWTQDDTVTVIRRDWDACLLTASEDDCMTRARILTTMLPPTSRPLTQCFAQCNSNAFCDSGIIRQCRVCGFGGICTTSLPQTPAPLPAFGVPDAQGK